MSNSVGRKCLRCLRSVTLCPLTVCHYTMIMCHYYYLLFFKQSNISLGLRIRTRIGSDCDVWRCEQAARHELNHSSQTKELGQTTYSESLRRLVLSGSFKAINVVILWLTWDQKVSLPCWAAGRTAESADLWKLISSCSSRLQQLLYVTQTSESANKWYSIQYIVYYYPQCVNVCSSWYISDLSCWTQETPTSRSVSRTESSSRRLWEPDDTLTSAAGVCSCGSTCCNICEQETIRTRYLHSLYVETEPGI